MSMKENMRTPNYGFNGRDASGRMEHLHNQNNPITTNQHYVNGLEGKSSLKGFDPKLVSAVRGMY